MRAIFGLVLVVGLGLAGFAVYMVQGYFEQQEAALARERAMAAEAVPTTFVLAVKHSVAYGEPLTPEDVMFVAYAEQYLPEGVFKSVEDLFPEGPEVPRTVLRQMDLNEPVLAAKVTEPGQDGGIATLLTRGMRAFAIRVDATSGVSGFLRPGDTVDVYWTGRSGTAEGSVTKLIESGLKLVAVDQTADSSRAGASIARTVTVEATPQQVAALAQAQATGGLSLSLVGLQDDTVASAIQVDQRALLGIEEREIVAVEAEEVCSVRTRRGAEVAQIVIPCTN